MKPARTISVATALLTASLGLLGLALLWAALGWHYARDTPLLNYVGFVIWEYGFAPYRDIFETSMPGVLGFHALLAGLGLTGNLAFMILAIVTVVCLAGFGALAIRPLGPGGAGLAAPLVVVAMFLMGPGWIMKIDMAGLLPISIALCLAVWPRPASPRLRQVLIGLLFGLVGTMKPHLAFGAPVVVTAAFLLSAYSPGPWSRNVMEFARHVGLSILGFMIPMLLMLGWLVQTGGLDRFVFVLTEYLPLHLSKTDWQEFLPEDARNQVKRAIWLRFGGHYALLPVAALTPVLAIVWRARLARRDLILVAMLGLSTLIYGLAPGLGGQFYVYYYFPFFFFALLSIAAGISLVERYGTRPWGPALWVIGISGFLAFFGVRFFDPSLFVPNSSQQVARMETALQDWVPEGGRVQPIDWTSGVVHAMLRQKIPPATPYLYDYHFHHHVGSQINTDLRADFIAILQADPPEVIMEAKEFPRVSGLNTSDSFPARDRFVATFYRPVADTSEFVVYLRRNIEVP